jgi:hypothetical protein
MGTSRGYKMPTGGNWTPLKNDARDFVQGTGGPQITSANVVTDFVRANGGFKSLRRGHGGSAPAGSSSRSGGSAAIGTARNLGAFLASVGQIGLEATLRERGLEALIGKSAADVSDALLDEFAGPASTLDNATAREALADLRDELLTDADTFADVEERLQAALDEFGLFGILASFFGYYVFKLFCRNFYEDWLKKVGTSKTTSKLREIQDYITSSLRAKLAGRKLGSTNWKGAEGTRLAEDVLKETLEVFGVTT